MLNRAQNIAQFVSTAMLVFAATYSFGAESVTPSPATPVQNEQLLVNWPEGFKVGSQAERNNMTMTEYVPADESVAGWTRMMTVQVFHGATVSALDFLQGLGQRYVNACPGTEVRGKGIQSGTVNGYPVSMLMLACPRNPSTEKPETTLFRIIKGTDALYSVQWAWRAVPSAEQIGQAVKSMAAVTVCDTRNAEHPCPQLAPLN
jgi:hypothetical protein